MPQPATEPDPQAAEKVAGHGTAPHPPAGWDAGRPATDALVEVARAVLRYPWPRDTAQRGMTPPPVPTALVAHAEHLRRAARATAPDHLHRRWAGSLHLLAGDGLPDHLWERAEGDLRWFGSLVGALVATRALTPGDVESLLPDAPEHLRPVLVRQLVLVALDDDDLDLATRHADRLGPDGWSAHRDIGLHLAERGDAPGFLARWRSYHAREHRWEVDRLRGRLVHEVAVRQGTAAALALVADRRIGERYRQAAWVSADRSVEGLLAFYAGEAGEHVDELSQLGALVAAIVRETPADATTEHARLAQVLDRLVAVDPTRDRSTMRMRDLQLQASWPAIVEEETLRQVRRAIRTPHVRADIGALARRPRGT